MKPDIAEALVQSFLRRFVRDGFRVTSELCELDKEALRAFTHDEREPSVTCDPSGEAETGRTGQIRFNLSCLEAAPDSETVVSIDFGTAYSKAAVWKAFDDHPLPLELNTVATGNKGVLLDSTLYIGSDQKIYLGGRAIDVSLRDDDPVRRRFDSPKQILSISGVEGIFSKVDPTVDPSAMFTNGDFLTLYIAYLCAMVSAELERIGVSRYALRRFAMPVWNVSQVEETSRILKQMFIDGQIIADSVPLELWSHGIGLDHAKSLVLDLRRELPATDPRRGTVRFIEGHVLEAAAAAAAIADTLKNRRPVVLVLDIGAGTTDLGVYYFVFPTAESGIRAKIAPFKGGAAARKIAGDRLDMHLIEFVKVRASLDEGNPVLFRLKRDVRIKKRDFFATGKLRVDGLDDIVFGLDEFLDSDGVTVFRAAIRELVQEIVSALGVQNVRGGDGLFAVITGGGSVGPIFDNFFEQCFEVDGRDVTFTALKAEPNWLVDFDPALAPIFPQLAVALGASSPDLPDEKHAIRGPLNFASHAPIVGLAPVYRS